MEDNQGKMSAIIRKDREDEKRMLPCRYFLSGLCQKASRCRFYHPAYPNSYGKPLPLPNAFSDSNNIKNSLNNGPYLNVGSSSNGNRSFNSGGGGGGSGYRSSSSTMMLQPTSRSPSSSYNNNNNNNNYFDTPTMDSLSSESFFDYDHNNNLGKIISGGHHGHGHGHGGHRGGGRKNKNFHPQPRGLIRDHHHHHDERDDEIPSQNTLFNHINWKNYLAPGLKPPVPTEVPNMKLMSSPARKLRNALFMNETKMTARGDTPPEGSGQLDGASNNSSEELAACGEKKGPAIDEDNNNNNGSAEGTGKMSAKQELLFKIKKIATEIADETPAVGDKCKFFHNVNLKASPNASLPTLIEAYDSDEEEEGEIPNGSSSSAASDPGSPISIQ